MLKISEIMESDRFPRLARTETLARAVELAAKYRLNQIPIIDEKGRTKKALDVFKLLEYLLEHVDKKACPPDSCISERINTIGAHESIKNAAFFPADRIVVDSEELLQGILTRSQIIHGLLHENDVYRMILDRQSTGIAFASPENRIIYTNTAFKEAVDPDNRNQDQIPIHSILSSLDMEGQAGGETKRYRFQIQGVSYQLEFVPLFNRSKRLGTLIFIRETLDVPEEANLIIDQVSGQKEDWRSLQVAFPDIVIADPKMKKVVERALKAANTLSNIFVSGETGVGKEIIAEIIHRMGPRANRPFIRVNCAAIPETLLESELFGYEPGAFTGAVREGKKGLIEEAEQGILFLDEINSLPLVLQAKLLRFLQYKEYYKLGGTKVHKADVRLIVAANTDMAELVKQGKFRQDLFYRLSVIPVEIPSLRERPNDINVLSLHFLKQYGQAYKIKKTLDKKVLDIFNEYDWPGNIRELEHLIENLVVLTNEETITPEHLPAGMLNGNNSTEKIRISVHEIIPLKDARTILERALFERAWQQCGTVREIASKLGVHHSTIVRKMSKHRETPFNDADIKAETAD